MIKLKNNIIKSTIVTLFILISITNAEQRLIKVGIYDDYPLAFIDSLGAPKGLYVDILNYVARKENWSLKYIPATWPECIEKLKRGDIDLLVAIAYTSQRDKVFDFNKETILINWGVVYTKKGLKINSILEMDGKRIAVLKGDIYYQKFKQLVESFELDCEFVEVEETRSVIKYLEEKKVDAGVIARLYEMRFPDIQKRLDRTPIIFGPVELRFAAPEKRNRWLLSTLDAYLRMLKQDPNSTYYKALDKWILMPEKTSIIPRWLVYTLIALILAGAVAVVTIFSLQHIIRKKTHEIRKLEQKYQDIFENAVECIYQTTPDGRFITVNSTCTKMFGYDSPEEMIREVKDIAHQIYVNPRDRDRFIREITERGIVKDFIAQVYRKDGSKIWVRENARVVKDKNGNILYFEGFATDITELVDAQEALKEKEKLYQTIVERVHDGIFILKGTSFIFVNDRALEISEYSKDELYRTNAYDLLHPDDRMKVYEMGMRRLRGEKVPDIYSARIITKSKKVKYLEFSVSLITVGGERAVLGAVRDITERKIQERKLRESYEKIYKILNQTVTSLASTVDFKDNYTGKHQKRVTMLAMKIAEKLGLEEDKKKALQFASAMHDIGKLGIPTDILIKPSKLTDKEFEFIKLHPKIGSQIAKQIDFPWPVAEIIYQHHERSDGSGYPRGLTGNQILEEARILAVADVVEAMCSPRPYRPAFDINTALEEIEKNKGKLYDPEVVDACISLFKNEEFYLD